MARLEWRTTGGVTKVSSGGVRVASRKRLRRETDLGEEVLRVGRAKGESTDEGGRDW